MSLYPTFEEKRSQNDVIPANDTVAKVVANSTNNNVNESHQPSLISRGSSSSQSLYPVLSEYFMGLNLLEQAEKAGIAVAKPNLNTQIITPLVPGQVTHGLRRLTLCKDSKGRVGLLVSAVDNGIFVSFVLEKSPAALGGLRFGDQILQINDVLLAGLSADKVHSLIRKLPVNDINLIVRDRPFERTVTMRKDQSGHCGFQFCKGKIETLVKDSSATRNGLLTDHQLLEVEGQNVIGMTDKEISEVMRKAGSTVTVTVIPSAIYDRMMKKLRWDFVKAKMDHSTPA